MYMALYLPSTVPEYLLLPLTIYCSRISLASTDHLAYLAEGHVSYFHNLVSVLVSFLPKKQNKTDKNLINILIFFCKTWESKGTKLDRVFLGKRRLRFFQIKLILHGRGYKGTQ
jgi:hypothetical protein